ncbi:unnamed protein product [Rotaria socialis]|uniref:Poly(3-hydroxybutyrate) depolymerase n=2 Tax=Rotaria socialis TaxID=392032 RepID=A0A818SFK6_9BILA|nr:unnamed protein product [Rotaria socialis]CAF4458006.1 unnamed protein product [Rotaria socialis]CAF4676152.1 unnamed protein product [Rotaria socialis]
MMTFGRNIFFIAFGIIISLVDTGALRTDVTVSGISSGAAMAVQLHMAYSKEISGCGILAGPPYECAGNLTGVTKCMKGPIEDISADDILLKLKSYELTENIDRLSNVQNDSIYVFAGTQDSVTLTSIVKLNEEIYSVLGANVKTNYELPATHGFPTDNFGESCDVLNTKDFINNCNFNMAYDVLNHLHGGQLIAPISNSTTPLIGQMIVFRQENFQNPPPSLATGDISSSAVLKWISATISLYNPTTWSWPTSGLFNLALSITTVPFEAQLPDTYSFSSGLDDYGFAYFPSACTKGQKCPIHVALHGCRQGKRFIGDTFITKTGYLEVAELNNLIVFFPQISPTTTSPMNPMGCWDWWGANAPNYAIKIAPQMSKIKQMIQTVRMINRAIVAAVSR